jgi:hypothetical protein
MCLKAWTTSVSALAFSGMTDDVGGTGIGGKGLGNTGVCERDLIYHSNLRR